MSVAYPDDEPYKGYKEYFVLLSQEDEDAPTIEKVMVDDFDGLIVPSRIDVGTYRFTLAGAFPEGRTVIFLASPRNTAMGNIAYQLDEDTVELAVGSLAEGDGEAPNFVDPPFTEVRRLDNGLSNFGFKIQVWD